MRLRARFSPSYRRRDGDLKETPQGAELQAAKDAEIVEGLSFLERNTTVAETIGESFIYGLPDDEWSSFARRVQALTEADIAVAAKKYLSAENLQMVVVGPAADLAKQFGSAHIATVYRATPSGVIQH